MNNTIDLKQERNSAVELLRIIAMFFIVMSHSSVHGSFPSVNSQITLNNYLLDWLCLGNLGSVIFVMISGYFLSVKERRSQSMVKLLAQVWFYSYICLAIHFLTGNTASIREIKRALFPTIYDEYWFFTAYIIVLIFCPYINIFIKNTSRKQLLSCLVIMMVLWSIIPTFTQMSMLGSELPQFLFFYLLGAYLRKYTDHALSMPKFRRWLIGCSAVLLLASSMVLRFFNDCIWPFSIFETWFYGRSSIFVIGLAIGMTAAAVYHKPWSNKIVNRISSCTFGVYLLHDNPFIREILWPVWMNNDAYYDSKTLIFRIFLSVVIVYAGCVFIELVRQKLFAKPLEYLIEKACGKFSYAVRRCAIYKSKY